MGNKIAKEALRRDGGDDICGGIRLSASGKGGFDIEKKKVGEAKTFAIEKERLELEREWTLNKPWLHIRSISLTFTRLRVSQTSRVNRRLRCMNKTIK